MSKRVAPFSLNSFVAPLNQNGNEWYKQVSYEDAKSIIKDKMVASCENIVAIGYYLKQIKETRQYEEGGYATIWACAFSEFQLDQSATSRYIDICKKYSVNGDSPLLDEKYKDFNKGQLQEMLTIKDDKLLAEITPEMSVRKIREKKKLLKTGDDENKNVEEQHKNTIEGEFREFIPKEEGKVNNIMEEHDNVKVTEYFETESPELKEKSAEIIEFECNKQTSLRGGYNIDEIDELIQEYNRCYDEAVEESSEMLKYICILDALEVLKDRLKHQV